MASEILWSNDLEHIKIVPQIQITNRVIAYTHKLINRMMAKCVSTKVRILCFKSWFCPNYLYLTFLICEEYL
jgi:hypothetical protein